MEYGTATVGRFRTFLALDLGGTNLRVCEVTLEGNHKFTLRQQKYKVSTELKTGEATVLFGMTLAVIKVVSVHA